MKLLRLLVFSIYSVCFFLLATSPAQTFEQQLLKEPADRLVRDIVEYGDPTRGAILFHQGFLTCTKCHAPSDGRPQLGPKLSEIGADTPKSKIVESVLAPSKEIKKGFEPIVVHKSDGQVVTGLKVKQDEGQLQVRDAATGTIVEISGQEIDEVATSKTSIMPNGLVNLLTSRQQFLDLCRYLFEVADGGARREMELKPAPALYSAKVPEYENDIDHAGILRSLDDESFKRGEAIYNRLCVNCHGTKDKPGSLPTSLAFASGKFKNGADPYAMYRTLTYGFGQMVAQSWMVPQQKYDVIHYIREAYLRKHNPSQYVPLDETYLAKLPMGSSRGPAPSNIEPWTQMDYGPSLVNTYEIGTDGTNFAYKGIAVRLDPGPGGVAHGKAWAIFDHDTMRLAAFWTGEGFIDWNGIHFNGRHGVHPRIVGDLQFQNPTGPGWSRPGSDDWEDNRLVGRDGRHYGPLDRDWAHYEGFYRHPERTVVRYTVGETAVLESYALGDFDGAFVLRRDLQTDANRVPLRLLLATEEPGTTILSDAFREAETHFVSAVLIGPPTNPNASSGDEERSSQHFDGQEYFVVESTKEIDAAGHDFSITARIRTKQDGPIFAITEDKPEWVPNGMTMFLRDGRLTFDIGWVGAVVSKSKITDGQWHDVAVTWNAQTGTVRLFVDGKLEQAKVMRPKKQLDAPVVRIAYTANDFPLDGRLFVGDIGQVEFYDSDLSKPEIQKLDSQRKPLARWEFANRRTEALPDISGKYVARRIRAAAGGNRRMENPLAIVALGDVSGLVWHVEKNGQIRIQFPSTTESREVQVQYVRLDDASQFDEFVRSAGEDFVPVHLEDFTSGGASRYPERLKTEPIIGSDDGPFAVDVLTHPDANPWFCRMRLTGLDFFENTDEGVVTAWDGNVWHVTGLDDPRAGLTWRRIADGLFQPLGVKIVDETIYVTCRDQIVILRDLNGDGETDYYQNFNNDHQVTDHFHEFAMGLQVDENRNFYYAKSARHALTALVPHHGTLLRVSSDGKRTDIVAQGFRAANGVCLNPDGTFIVTDQEGHWNPKNRINWVKEGGFYGNMFAYHDITDESDEAMEQPLCWITNEFDRSPAELVWVESEAWGPLNGSLLNLSYGYGKLYVVPHEEINGQKQGGMCPFPIPQFPTGVMRGRFHPKNGQLYCCGMFAWAGTQQQPGGFYRVRYTGKPVHLPLKLNATERGMSISFSGELDRASAVDVDNYAVKTWSLKRTKNYGSKHYDERPLPIKSVTLSDDGKTVFLEMPEIKPTWCMEIKFDIRGSQGEVVRNRIHNTIHHLAPRN